jgi:hypothetical protein
VAELKQPFLRFARVVELRTPVRMSAETISGALDRVDDAMLSRIPRCSIQGAPTSDQW